MAGLSSTGIAGFLSSAKFTGKKILNAAGELVSEVVSTFVGGVSGWIIQNNGDAEFKSIYARDKIVTNEYVYNRIRVTEDEEVITSNGKILSSSDNGDGTYTIYLDLREGDINPFADGDLLQGYYHNPENSGVIYAVQKMTVQADPDKTDQSMIVTCEDGSLPYRYMIIVRVGNLFDTDRQSFIRISSRTNCQYFHDGINSFAALDNPDNIKCAIGKADIGLIPAWATAAIGNVRRWFGLIADGVILRGTFVLKSSGTTMEQELDGMAEKFVDVETKFEIREGQISSKITQAEVYAENAEKAAQTATSKASEATQTADGFKQTVSETTTAVNKAVKDAQDAAAGAAGSASDAASKLVTIVEKESSINQTASQISTKVTEATTAASNAANSANAAAGSAQTASSKASEVVQTANKISSKVTEVATAASIAASSASAAAESADSAAGSAQTATSKASEVVQTADTFKTTVSETTTKAVNDAVAGADAKITEKVSTAVKQSARDWKVEVLNGEDNVLAAINADKSGVSIEGNKINLKGGVVVQGSFSSPFHKYTDKFIETDGEHDYDNVVPTTYSENTTMELSWDLSQNGRRRVLVNYKWNGETSYGYVKITAPSGKYFFENGMGYSDLYFSREVVELLGYGDDTEFLGWIVLNRRDVRTTQAYGEYRPVLAQGIVTVNSETDVKIKYRTFRGSIMSVSRISKGIYRVTFPSGWHVYTNYFVLLTGMGYCVGQVTQTPAKANLLAQNSPATGNPSFDVSISDDDTLNDGSFAFTMYSTADWDMYS